MMKRKGNNMPAVMRYGGQSAKNKLCILQNRVMYNIMRNALCIGHLLLHSICTATVTAGNWLAAQCPVMFPLFGRLVCLHCKFVHNMQLLVSFRGILPQTVVNRMNGGRAIEYYDRLCHWL